MNLGKGQPEERARAILKAARAHFMKNGYDGAKMEFIARDAGVSTATIYALHRGKPELFRCVMRDVVASFTGLLDDAESARGDADSKLRTVCLAYARFMASGATRRLYRLVSAGQPHFAEIGRDMHAEAHNLLGAALLRVLKDLESRGEIRLDRPSIAVRALQGMLEHNTLTMAMLLGDDSPPLETIDDTVDEAVRVFLAAYAVN